MARKGEKPSLIRDPQNIPVNREVFLDVWLEKLSIMELSERFPHQISGGQAQRVALARAFITGFPVLLLDEPFSALDFSLKIQLRTLLKTLVRESGVAALLVTHEPSDLEMLADKIATLKDGKITIKDASR